MITITDKIHVTRHTDRIGMAVPYQQYSVGVPLTLDEARRLADALALLDAAADAEVQEAAAMLEVA